MKKIYSMIAGMAISIACFNIQVNAANTDLVDLTDRITNPGFENDLSGWTVQDGTFTDETSMTPVISTQRKLTGAKSISFNTQYGAAKVDSSARQMEYLNRGLVGVKVSDGVFLSWRSLGTDDSQTEFNCTEMRH